MTKSHVQQAFHGANLAMTEVEGGRAALLRLQNAACEQCAKEMTVAPSAEPNPASACPKAGSSAHMQALIDKAGI